MLRIIVNKIDVRYVYPFCERIGKNIKLIK